MPALNLESVVIQDSYKPQTESSVRSTVTAPLNNSLASASSIQRHLESKLHHL